MPFVYGAAMILVSCAILVIGRPNLARADGVHESKLAEAEGIAIGAATLA